MATITMDEDLLMALGWEITSKNKRVVCVEPPQNGKQLIETNKKCARHDNHTKIH